MRSPLNDALNRKWSEASATLEKLERELAAEREKIACIEMDRDHARLDAKTERERADRNQEDAERWNLLCELWHASTELSLMQEEDGRWSIKQVEDIDGEMFYQLWGDTPDAAIDAARRK